MWLFGRVAGLYCALVLQHLWNWFAVGPVGLQPISYWAMYGLLMLIALVFAAGRRRTVTNAPTVAGASCPRWHYLVSG